MSATAYDEENQDALSVRPRACAFSIWLSSIESCEVSGSSLFWMALTASSFWRASVT